MVISTTFVSTRILVITYPPISMHQPSPKLKVYILFEDKIDIMRK